MKKKILCAFLCAAMATTMLAGCGKKTEAGGTAEDGGKVLNIYVWNNEWRERVEQNYPGYEKISDEEGKIGDVQVKWTTNPNEQGVYQNKLDEALMNQDNAAADEKIDIFLIEADYALKYIDSKYTLTMADIGLEDSVFDDQFQYTKDVVTDANGKIKGSSWQACSGAMIYRRDLAKEVLGSDDPAEVQKAVADWDKFLETADKMKAKGYKMVSSVNDTYRVFSNNTTSKWVEDGKTDINIDPSIKKWIEMSKKMVDNKQCDTFGQWGDDWKKGFYMTGDVFCYFGPAWLVDFCMAVNEDGSVGKAGNWGLTAGPQGFYWGGTWICACAGTDNKTLVADIIKKMTTDEQILTDIVKKNGDCVNSDKVLTKFANDTTFGQTYLGGQNPYPILLSFVKKIDLSNQCKYDQACTEEMQGQMKNYFDGNATYDEALEAFYKAVGERHPELAK